jgi:hypothetical protein
MYRKKMPEKKSKKKIVIGVIALLTILSIGLFWGRSEKKAPDPQKMQAVEAVKYMASAEFATLPESQKEIFVEKMRENHKEGPPPREMFSGLNENERKALHKNMGKVMHKKMRERVKKFFEMSPEEQDDFLDQEVEKMKKRHERDKAEGRNGPPPGGAPGGDPGRMQNMLENTDSTSRAQMHEFHNRLHERMKNSSR